MPADFQGGEIWNRSIVDLADPTDYYPPVRVSSRDIPETLTDLTLAILDSKRRRKLDEEGFSRAHEFTGVLYGVAREVTDGIVIGLPKTFDGLEYEVVLRMPTSKESHGQA